MSLDGAVLVNEAVADEAILRDGDLSGDAAVGRDEPARVLALLVQDLDGVPAAAVSLDVN